MQPIVQLGQKSLDLLAAFGRFWTFAWQTWVWSFAAVRYGRNWRLLGQQFYEIGVLTVPVIVVTGTFVGLVLAVQVIDQFQAMGLEERMGVVVNLSIVKELGPVLAGVMLAGRVGGALTAELGTMNVTEQIDALRSMGTDPIRYLAAPRFAACLLLTPVLTWYCDIMGAWAGWLIAVKIYGVPSEPYWYFTADAVEGWDVLVGAIKSLMFGGLIGLVACYKGFHCRAGAQGVGRACTESFVASFIVILIVDFFVAIFLKGVYEAIWGFKPLL